MQAEGGAAHPSLRYSEEKGAGDEEMVADIIQCRTVSPQRFCSSCLLKIWKQLRTTILQSRNPFLFGTDSNA